MTNDNTDDNNNNDNNNDMIVSYNISFLSYDLVRLEVKIYSSVSWLVLWKKQKNVKIGYK